MIKPRGLTVGWAAFAGVLAVLAAVALTVLGGAKGWIGAIFILRVLTYCRVRFLARVPSRYRRSEIDPSLTGC